MTLLSFETTSPSSGGFGLASSTRFVVCVVMTTVTPPAPSALQWTADPWDRGRDGRVWLEVAVTVF